MRALVVQCREPVHAVDAALGDPAAEQALDLVGRRPRLDREGGDMPVGESLDQGLPHAALVEHDDDAAALAEFDPGGYALVEGRAQGRHRDAPRECVGGGQIAPDQGVDRGRDVWCRCLDRCCLGGCRLAGCRLGGCRLGGCCLGGCRLGGCRLGGCRLGGCRGLEAGLVADPADDVVEGGEVA